MGAQRTRPPSRVLVILGARGIGDAAEALAAFELIARHWPDTQVDVGYFKEPQRPMLETSPHVTELVRLYGHVRDARKSWRLIRPNAEALRGYDAALVLARHEQVGWPIKLAARIARVRLLHRHGYRYRDRRRSAFTDFPAHVFFQLVTAALLLERPLAEIRTPRLTPSEPDRGFAEDFLVANGLADSQVVLLNTRGPQYTDMGTWGFDRYAGVANALVTHGLAVIINGGTRLQIEEVAHASERLDASVVLLETPTPTQLAAVLARCDLVVGEPSGPLCVAQAVGTRTLTLEGPGEHDYPGHNRDGPVWWPRPKEHQIISRVAWCQATTGPACLCSRPAPSRPVQRTLRSLGLWDPVKRVLKVTGLRRSRSGQPEEQFPCLQALAVRDVVTAALDHLADRRG